MMENGRAKDAKTEATMPWMMNINCCRSCGK
jgi:hypothetical protein